MLHWEPTLYTGGAALHQETGGIGEVTVPPCDITKDRRRVVEKLKLHKKEGMDLDLSYFWRVHYIEYISADAEPGTCTTPSNFPRTAEFSQTPQCTAATPRQSGRSRRRRGGERKERVALGRQLIDDLQQCHLIGAPDPDSSHPVPAKWRR